MFLDDYVEITNSTKIRNFQKQIPSTGVHGVYLSHSNFKGSIRTYTFSVTNLRVNIIGFFFLSLVQCHCGLNWLGVPLLTFSKGAYDPPSLHKPEFFPTQANIRFFLVLVEDCRFRFLLFFLCIFQAKIFLYYKMWRQKNKIKHI